MLKKIFFLLSIFCLFFGFTKMLMAEVNLTTTGYMEVKGIFVKENFIDGQTFSADSSNAYYKQKMIIDPVLHVNDKVRIHGRVTILERFWEGSTGTGLGDDITKSDDRVNYRARNNNFWWERLYLSFPLMGGHLYVGRQSGGSWGTWFQDNDANRDRVKYVRKFGRSLVVALIEKSTEGDGGFNGGIPEFLTLYPQSNDIWTKSHDDINSYVLGAVIPIGDNFIWKPCSYNVNYQNRKGWHYLFLNEFAYNFKNFKFDSEVNYRWGKWKNYLPDGDMEFGQLSAWAEGTVDIGAVRLALGGFYLEGESDSSVSSGNKRNTVWSIGGEFQPYLLFLSEDVGLLWNSTGVPNGTVGSSGYTSFYGKASYRINENMRMSAIIGYLSAAEMELAAVDKELGWEFDVNFEWRFMDNVSYVADFGYVKSGDYFRSAYAGVKSEDLTNDPYGMRHMIVLKW